MRRFLMPMIMGAVVLSSAVLTGCGPSDPYDYYNASGTVTFDGKPLPRGTIQFLPDTAKDNSGPAGFADVKDGKYDTSVGGKGTIGGPHRVVISGYDGQADPANELPLGLPLFSDYRTEVEIPKEDTTQNFDVPAAAATAGQTQAPSGP